jgi:hypothetical protein
VCKAIKVYNTIWASNFDLALASYN